MSLHKISVTYIKWY